MEAEDGHLILFVLNVDNRHWVAGSVDLHEECIHIGDSYGGFGGVHNALEPLQTWIERAFGQKFVVRFDLPVGRQEDSYSCGVFAISALATRSMETAILTHEERHLARASSFLNVVELHLKVIQRQNNLEPLAESSGTIDEFSDGEESGMELNEGDHSYFTSEDEAYTAEESGSEGRSGWSGRSETDDSGGSESGDDSEKDMECSKSGNKDAVASNLRGASTDSLVNFDCLQLNPREEGKHNSTTTTQSKGKKRKAEDESEQPGDQSRAKMRSSGRAKSKSTTHTKKMKTAEYDKKTMEKIENGVIEADRLEKFTQCIREIDPHATIDEANPWRVRHSKCDNWLTTYPAYTVKDFKDHCERNTCAKKRGKGAAKPGAGMSLLQSFGFTRTHANKPRGANLSSQTSTPHISHHKLACRGLKNTEMDGISGYINRTGYSGGGSHSVTFYAKKLFGTQYEKLTPAQKEQVAAHSLQDQRWRIARIDKSVYSTTCLGSVEHTSTTNGPPCTHCLQLLGDKGFKKAVRRRPKDAASVKYTNRRFLNYSAGRIVAQTKGIAELLDENDTRTMAARFAARIVLDPKSDHNVFSGLIHATVTQHSKQIRGVGRQNFHYAPAWDDFCHAICVQSKSAYHTLRSHFPARLPSSFHQIRSREPKFPLGIDTNYISTLTRSCMQQVQYTGPVCLSCDDTKLLPSLQAYYDGSKQEWKLIGSTGDPVNIKNNDELIKVLQQNNFEKASKVRLWVVQIPLQGVAPLAIAALPIGSNMPAPVLANHLKTVLDALHDAEIGVVAYASDGSTVEQNVQDLVSKASTHHQDFVIPCGTDECSDTGPWTPGDSSVTFKLGFYREKPLVMIQDSKHALKTCRNNLFSGARLQSSTT
ncbi:hypothetical protein FS749_004343 [Ceratobasidium sp. UAMH 11750]|nr:hypothetical protein FS749_004343 [Ceratobasidium sp. UAMH 11750]